MFLTPPTESSLTNEMLFYSGPVLYLATLTYRTRINDLNEDVYVYVRDVYFKNEIIEAIHEDEWCVYICDAISAVITLFFISSN